MDTIDILQELSAGIVWVPFLVLAGKLFKGNKEYLLFWLFLISSGLIDLIGYVLPEGDVGDRIYYPFHLIYLFVEGILIVSITIERISLDDKTKLLIKRALFIIILLCTLLIPLSLLDGNWERFINLSSIFSGGLLVTFSFLSAFSLLSLAESTYDLIGNPWFWILAGIFVYSFGSFFIDLLIPTQMAYYVYFLRHIMNVIRGCFFLIGVFKINSIIKLL
jgi:hypothetical protein